VLKLNANDYTTSLSGLKFKIAHRRADTGKWSATPKTQRKRMIAFLQDVIADLEREPPEDTPVATKRTRQAASRTSRRPASPPSIRKGGWRRRTGAEDLSEG